MLKLYGFARVNKGARGNTRDLRVLWTLEEIGLPYEIVGMDHPNHDLDSPGYRALNPFGQIPVIDDDGVVVSESGAILLYLARKSGKLMPHDLAGEAQVLRWSFAALTTIELPVLSLWFVNLSGGKDSKPSEALHGWAEMRLKQLDGWLTNRQFVATEDFTVADVLMTHVLDAGTQKEMLKPYPNLLAYRARCTDAALLSNLLELYIHDLSAAFPSVELGSDGRFGYSKLALYWSEPDRHFPFLIRWDSRVVGFALATRGSPASDDPNVFDVAEFFVIRRHRRSGVGRRAAMLLWNRLPGSWIVRASEGVPVAVPFWRSVVAEFTSGAAAEFKRPGSPHGWHVFSFASAG